MNTGRITEAPKQVVGGVKIEQSPESLLAAYQRAMAKKIQLAKALTEVDADIARLAPLVKGAAKKALEAMEQQRILLTALAAEG